MRKLVLAAIAAFFMPVAYAGDPVVAVDATALQPKPVYATGNAMWVVLQGSSTTVPAAGATSALAVQIVDGSGNQITSFGGGTQYTDQATFTNATNIGNQVMGAYQSSPSACEDNSLCAIGITSSREVKVDLSATVETYFSDTATAVVEVAGATYADDDDFTDGTSKSNLAGGVAETTNTPSTVTDGDIGAFGMTLNRAIKNYAIADENQLGPVTCVVGGTSTDNTALTTTIATEKQVVTYYSFQGEGAVEVWLEDDDATEITPHCVIAASGDGCVFNPNHPGTLQTNEDGDTITLQLSAAVVVNYTMCWTSID